MAIWHQEATHEECFPMSRMSKDQRRRRKLQERNKRRRKEGSNPDDGPFFTAQRPYIPMQKLLRVGEGEELTLLPDGTEKKTHTVHWRNDEYAVAVYLPGCDNELTQVTVQR